MPVPEFITVPAHSVRPSDDLLVDRTTKELDESGEPMAQLRHADVGEKWVYLKLAEPLGRKATIKVGVYDGVPVIRMVDTPEDKMKKFHERLATRALLDLKKYWDIRNSVAEDLTAGVKEEGRYYYGYGSDNRGFKSVGRYGPVSRALEDMALYEHRCERWESVSEDINNGSTPVSALNAEIERVKDRILTGYINNEEAEHARRWLRDASNLLDREL